MTFGSLIGKLHANSGYRFSAHLIFWTMELLISWYASIISFNAYKNFTDQTVWKLALSGTLSLAVVYYPLVYVLVPLLKKGRYLWGILGVAMLLLLYGVLNTWTEQLLITRCAPCLLQLKISNPDYYHFLHIAFFNRLFAKLATMGLLIGLIFSISVPLAVKITLQSFRQQLAAVRLAKENVELEFNFLKSQVNPHFLFNSLNNIYGLILKNENNKAAATVARLAEFMRYTLYDSANDRSALLKEVDLLKDYIELEQIRLNHARVDFTFELNDQCADVPTLLLMPVIENAFKYCADRKDALICIQLTANPGRLKLLVGNTIDENSQLHKSGGIGLQNLKKRLNLYYPGKHDYTYQLTDDYYLTTIALDL